jgi:CBS domain-containing protein
MLSVGEMMRHNIGVVPPHAPVRRVVEVMVDTGVEGVLVVDGRGRVVGSIGDEQLVARLHAGRNLRSWRRLVAASGAPWTDESRFDFVAADLMLSRVVAVDPGTSLRSAIRLFDEYAVNVIPVVDHGVLVGAVFRRDLVRQLLLPDSFGHPAEI